ncbi:MAG: hypothetical protein HRU20_10665 [Pseudomonadales bacterium]|nr:hypothetical protein [Pseudomonadales bacterium]
MQNPLLRKLTFIAFAGLSSTLVSAGECAKIKDGTILNPVGEVITKSEDQWGYNYKKHSFNGGYCDAYQGADWCMEYNDIHVTMKWNNAWMSKKDCDYDGTLDRHWGHDSFIDSRAKLTTAQHGEYIDDFGAIQHWFIEQKIKAVPSEAWQEGEYWLKENKKGKTIVIGKEIWGEFAIIKETSYDSGSDDKLISIKYRKFSKQLLEELRQTH